jgi:hypothetical protein
VLRRSQIFVVLRFPPAASSVGAASKLNWGAQILSIHAAPTELARNFLRCSYKDSAPTEHVAPLRALRSSVQCKTLTLQRTLLMQATTHSKQRRAQIFDGARKNQGLRYQRGLAGAEPGRVTRSGNQEQLLLPIVRHLGCSVCLVMRDEDAEALNELVLERRRLIRRLDELNDLLLEVDLRTIEPALRKGSSTIH